MLGIDGIVKSRKEKAMLPEQKVRIKIDKQLRKQNIVSRNVYLPNSTTIVDVANRFVKGRYT